MFVHKWRSLHNTKSSEAGQFYPWSLLRVTCTLDVFIITNTLNDSQDILCMRGCFVGHISSVLCYFDKLDSLLKVCLLKSFRQSSYASCGIWVIEVLIVFMQKVIWSAIQRSLFFAA